MHYPIIDPVIISLGPVAVRWYGLAYLAAVLVGWWLGVRRARRLGGWHADEVGDLAFYAALGAVLGGRIGYVLFYASDRLLADPLFLVRMWDGGMSFHGGLLGVGVALVLFARRTQRSFGAVADFVAPLAPLGLGFGRLGNFMNTELPGRVTTMPWGLEYPCSAVRDITAGCSGYWEGVLRHPSSLYQALTEGLLLFLLVYGFARRPRPTYSVTGVFLAGYGTLRFFTEFFRQPDAHIGYIAFGWLTMGQLLSLPMLLAGIALIAWAYLRDVPASERSGT